VEVTLKPVSGLHFANVLLGIEVKSCGETLMNSTEYLRCLHLVMESKLQREGHLLLPAGESSVEEVTDIQRALQLARAYLVSDSTA